MHQTGQLVDALKRVLKLKGITYADLAKAIDLSEASIKRIFADRSFTIKRLEQICQHLDISIYELAKLASQQEQPRSSTITMEQEAALAKNPVLLAVFYLLLNGWTPYRIKTRLAMNESQSAKALTSLQKLGLV